MKATAYAALVLGLVSAALAQTQTLAPSPTESVGCEPHGDHWHCDGPRETAATAGATTPTTTGTGAASTTSSATHDDDTDDDHDDHDSDHDDDHSSGTLKPSPTESYGCEAHGDHWHCAGAVTASGASTLLTAASTTAAGSTGGVTSSTVPGAAARYQDAGLGLVGLAAVVAMAV